MDVRVRIEGLDKVLAKLNSAVYAGPLRNFFQRAAISVSNRAKVRAPVDTGRLRSSIGTEVDPAPVPHWAKVGTRVKYAKPMEFGTGLLSEAPDSKHKRHYPPGNALNTWAKRHGFDSGFAVARIIGRRGGLRPRRFLRGGFEDSMATITGLVRRLADDVLGEWKK